jgi:hypothetical protein
MNIKFSTNNTPIVIKSGSISAFNQLKNLTDVLLANTQTGNLLLYNSANQTFILQSANNLNISNIDGGSF